MSVKISPLEIQVGTYYDLRGKGCGGGENAGWRERTMRTCETLVDVIRSLQI